MFGIQGQKFVEAIGTQLICPYCRHKLRARQVLIAPSPLSLCDGKLFSSHRKKVEEMESNWDHYPFADYKLKSVSKKSYILRRVS